MWIISASLTPLLTTYYYNFLLNPGMRMIIQDLAICEGLPLIRTAGCIWRMTTGIASKSFHLTALVIRFTLPLSGNPTTVATQIPNSIGRTGLPSTAAIMSSLPIELTTASKNVPQPPVHLGTARLFMAAMGRVMAIINLINLVDYGSIPQIISTLLILLTIGS